VELYGWACVGGAGGRNERIVGGSRHLAAINVSSRILELEERECVMNELQLFKLEVVSRGELPHRTSDL
jgi:hypothetical protein